jgi:hypothetical protein
MENIESKIKELYEIQDWSQRIDQIKNIKSMIQTENDNYNTTLASLDKVSVKKYNIDKIITEFNESPLDKKIKYYQYLNTYINSIEKELFE